jgi:hypothetical protein
MPVNDWLTIEELRRKMDYDPDTGKLTWRELRNSKRIGEEAKSLDVGGYVQVSFGVGKIAKGHRLAWAHYNGEWPDGHIDHINGVRNDNRIANLRVVTNAINCQNKRKALPTSKTGILGVVKVGERYQANIHYDRKKRYLGTYSTPEEAHEVYIQAKRQLHEGCTL